METKDKKRSSLNSTVPSTEQRFTKIFLGCLVGASLGTAFHIYVVNTLPLPATDKFIFGAVLTLLTSIGFGFSRTVRCICLLIIPNFFGKFGRSFVTSAAMMSVLSGPVENILQNSQESARSMACTASLTLNHSKQVMDLVHRPFTNAFKDIGGQTEDIKVIAEKIKEEFSKIEREVEGDKRTSSDSSPSPQSASDIKASYQQKFNFQCEDMFSVAVQNCKDQLADIHGRCFNVIKVPIAKNILCAPLTANFVCNVITWLDNVCDSSNVDTKNLGREYLRAKNSLGKLDEEFQAKMKWKLEKPEMPPVYKRVSVSEIQGTIKHEISKKKIWFDVAYKLISILLSFTFLLVLLSANNYNSDYLTNLRFDNVYMTDYFRRIDNRRKAKGQNSLLPLKKMEKKDLIEPMVWSLRTEERQKLIKGTIRLSCQLFVTILLLAFDFFFYTTLDLIRRHSQLDFQFHGEHYFRVAVHGHGKLAELFQRVFEAFDSAHTLAGISTNKECLPIPTRLSAFKVSYMCALWFSVWILLCLEAWGLRLRRVICAYHYVKREKTRILFLYNDCLRKREGYLRQMRKRVQRLAREDRLSDKLSSTSILKSKFPRLCGWISAIGMGKKKCLVCNEWENKRSYHCPNKGCYFMYCWECWNDVTVCYACSPNRFDESTGGETSDEGS